MNRETIGNILKVSLSMIFIICFFSAPATANGGTPLIWASIAYLFLGNFLIGILEGCILSIIYKPKWSVSIIVMVLANYFSCIAGYVLAYLAADGLLKTISSGVTIMNVGTFLICMTVFLVVFTIILEWPFCYFILRKKEKPVWLSLKVSAIVQAVSYLILIVTFVPLSHISLITKVKKAPVETFAPKQPYTIYFISPGSHGISKIGIDGSNLKAMANRKDVFCKELSIKKTKDQDGWDLYCNAENKSNKSEKRILIAEKISHKGFYRAGEDMRKGEGSISNAFGDANCLYGCNVRVETGFWPSQGIDVGSINITIDTPFTQWYSRYATVIPGEQVVYQLDDQIVLYDYKKNKMGLITRGYSPVVVDESK